MIEIGLYAVALLLLTAASAFCSSSEAAYFSLPTSRVNIWRRSPNKNERLTASLLSSSRQLLVLIFFLNTVVNILLQNTASNICEGTGPSQLLKVGLPLVLILVFGEFLPKYLGMIRSEPLAIAAAPFFETIGKLAAPILQAITTSAELLARFFFFFLRPAPHLSRGEIVKLIDTGAAKKILSQEEAALVHKALELEWTQVREIMQPRSSLPFIRNSQLSQESVVEKMAAVRHTLLLVEADDNYPIGAINGSEIILLKRGDVSKAVFMARQQLFFAPESMSSRRLLQEFIARHASLACVVDEHGTVSGYVTWEDLVQRILVPHKEQPSEELSAAVVAGSTTIQEINKLFHTSLKARYQSATLGGWLTEMLDGIPAAGTTYVTDDLVFRIVTSDEKSVQQVFVQRQQRSGG